MTSAVTSNRPGPADAVDSQDYRLQAMRAHEGSAVSKPPLHPLSISVAPVDDDGCIPACITPVSVTRQNSSDTTSTDGEPVSTSPSASASGSSLPVLTVEPCDPEDIRSMEPLLLNKAAQRFDISAMASWLTKPLALPPLPEHILSSVPAYCPPSSLPLLSPFSPSTPPHCPSPSASPSPSLSPSRSGQSPSALLDDEKAGDEEANESGSLFGDTPTKENLEKLQIPFLNLDSLEVSAAHDSNCRCKNCCEARSVLSYSSHFI